MLVKSCLAVVIIWESSTKFARRMWKYVSKYDNLSLNKSVIKTSVDFRPISQMERFLAYL